MKPPSKFEPIWDEHSRIFWVEREGPNGEISSMVYSGLTSPMFSSPRAVVRRLDILPKNELKTRWEYQFQSEHFKKGFWRDFGEYLLLPGEEGGARAIRVDTGEKVWELGYKVPFFAVPRFANGQLQMTFTDRCWFIVEAHTGKILQHEKAPNEAALNAVDRSFREESSSEVLSSEVFYQRSRIYASAGLQVSLYQREKKPDEPEPIPGDYPIEEWNLQGRLAVVKTKLLAVLKKDEELALGIFSLPSLEPFRLLPFPKDYSFIEGGYRVQDLLVFAVSHKSYEPTFVVDVQRGSLVAHLAAKDSSEDTRRSSHLFLFDHKVAWSGYL